MDSDRELKQFSDELSRRQYHPRLPSRVGDVLNQLMAKRGYNQTRSNQQREQVWAEATGEPLASQSRAVKLSRGVLTVMVVNSSVMQELVFQQMILVKKINELNPELQIKSLRFRVGEI